MFERIDVEESIDEVVDALLIDVDDHCEDGPALVQVPDCGRLPTISGVTGPGLGSPMPDADRLGRGGGSCG